MLEPILTSLPDISLVRPSSNTDKARLNQDKLTKIRRLLIINIAERKDTNIIHISVVLIVIKNLYYNYLLFGKNLVQLEPQYDTDTHA